MQVHARCKIYQDLHLSTIKSSNFQDLTIFVRFSNKRTYYFFGQKSISIFWGYHMISNSVFGADLEKK